MHEIKEKVEMTEPGIAERIMNWILYGNGEWTAKYREQHFKNRNHD